MQKLLLFILISGFLFQSCNSDNKTAKPEIGEDTSTKANKAQIPVIDTLTIEVDSTGAEIFASFLIKFNTDSIFQISRVKFPFYFKSKPCGEKMKVQKVNKDKWTMYKLVYEDSFATMKEFPFKQKIVISKNKAEVIWHGINGDYMHDTSTFFLIDNKWFFVEDLETGC